MSIRSLTADQVSSFVVIPGIIVSASRTRPKAVKMQLICSNCSTRIEVSARDGFSHVTLPLRCTGQTRESIAAAQGAPCPLDPFLVLPDECVFVDSQVGGVLILYLYLHWILSCCFSCFGISIVYFAGFLSVQSSNIFFTCLLEAYLLK